MPKTYKNDLTGKTFGYLTVFEWNYFKSIKGKHHFWDCLCICGNKTTVRQDHLKSFKISSCGCKRRENNKDLQIKNQYEFVNNEIIKIKASNSDDYFEIDFEDFDKIKSHSWYKNKKGYIISRIDNKLIRIHRHILEIKDKSLIVDHIDRNKLNNKKNNLRVCTNQQNARNKENPKNNKSGLRGVFWNKEKRKWQTKIGDKFLGYYDDIHDAIDTRIKFELSLYKEFSPFYKDFNESKRGIKK